jgi:hypothetical protein
VKTKFVWSLGWDPRNHEEIRNGLKNKIHIREVNFKVLEKSINFSMRQLRFLDGSRGPLVGPKSLKDLHGTEGELTVPLGPGAQAHQGPIGQPRGTLGGTNLGGKKTFPYPFPAMGIPITMHQSTATL